MKLNYRLRTSNNTLTTIPIIMIHGLFGNLNNLGSIATYLNQYYNIIQIDLRNHGNSPHNKIMTYVVMAQDIINILDHLSIKKCTVIGHSMGGKVAMTLSTINPQRINKIIIIDIAPMEYNIYKYENIFNAINYINKYNIKNKNDAANIMQHNNIEKNVILFLLKSFYQGSWNFNFHFIEKNYININSWPLHNIWNGPILFIKGELSPYINKIGIQNIYKQFPHACIKTVPHSNHWVHYEYPIHVSNIIIKFLN